MAITAGAVQSLYRGDFISAYIGLRYGPSAELFGAPDSNRGQFGYDVGPGLTVLMSGGLGALRTTAARAYSVAFETIIPKVGAGTRPAHFTAANKALQAAIASDSSFARVMQQLGITVPQKLGQSPAGWSWHHVPDQPGVMQLVPRGQHQGSAWQHLLHPNGEGGFKIWGIEF
jgi:hypothetical protein